MGNQQSTARKIADYFIRKLEQGVKPWERPWNSVAPKGRPLRHNGQPYRGVNVGMLWGAADERGYTSPFWMTRRQAEQYGGIIRRGARPTMSIFASPAKIAGKPDMLGEVTTRSIFFLRVFMVYNASEIDGLPVHYTPEHDPNVVDPIPAEHRAAEFFSKLPATVRHGGNRAFFNRISDHIQMPHMRQFPAEAHYWATFAHEATHWTGAQSRLNRTFGKRFGDQAYAFEEIVAEIGSHYLAEDLGLPSGLHDSHANYIGSWLQVLKNDPQAIILASNLAEKAATYLTAKVADHKAPDIALAA